MFGVGTQEILIVLLVVLILFGGKRIPELARGLGKGMADFRRALRDVQREVDLDLLREPPPSSRKVPPEDQSAGKGDQPSTTDEKKQ